MKKLTEKKYRISDWSGGKTTQIAIEPEDALYADRRFLWRLSSTAVDLEESDFTSLPGYTRLITPIRGEMALSHNGDAPVAIEPYEVHAFDGADVTRARGRCTDFNLMLRKGEYGGSIIPLRGDREEAILRPEPGCETAIVYCAEGRAAVTCGDERLELSKGEAALLQNGPIGPITAAFPALGAVLCAQVWRTR